MRSRKIQKLEKVLAENIKRTPQKIRNEFRALLHEYLFVRVKPVYKGEFDYTPHQLERSQSCPELTVYRNPNSPNTKRKRAMSECYRYNVMQKTQSETELEKIDKERTFKPSNAFMHQKDLILKFFDALSDAAIRGKKEDNIEIQGIQGFSDADILASEATTGTSNIAMRRRAISDVRPPPVYETSNNGFTWYGDDATAALKEFRKRKSLLFFESKAEKLTMFKKIKNKLKFKNDVDIEKQNVEFENNNRRPSLRNVPDRKASDIQDPILEHTSIADVLRALADLTVNAEEPKRKLGTASLTPPQIESPPKQRRMSIFPSNRRTSLIPPGPEHQTIRRFSLRPVPERELRSPSFVAETRNSFKINNMNRKFSVKPIAMIVNESSPVRTQVNRKKRTDSSNSEKQ